MLDIVGYETVAGDLLLAQRQIFLLTDKVVFALIHILIIVVIIVEFVVILAWILILHRLPQLHLLFQRHSSSISRFLLLSHVLRGLLLTVRQVARAFVSLPIRVEQRCSIRDGLGLVLVDAHQQV